MILILEGKGGMLTSSRPFSFFPVLSSQFQEHFDNILQYKEGWKQVTYIKKYCVKRNTILNSKLPKLFKQISFWVVSLLFSFKCFGNSYLHYQKSVTKNLSALIYFSCCSFENLNWYSCQLTFALCSLWLFYHSVTSCCLPCSLPMTPTVKWSVCMCLSILAVLSAEARSHAPQALPASAQSGATDVRMAGDCRRLLLVSPLHARFWSSISWLCNFFLVCVSSTH